MSPGDHIDFPPELFTRSLPLIGFSGLNILNNSVHNTIWESFNKNQEPSFVSFRLLEPGHRFPVIKPKKLSYEKYIPKGLLKRNWMRKYLYEVPAVVVNLLDLEWDDPNWEAKKDECVNQVRTLRAALEGRYTRFAIILIQKTAPLPAADDIAASDRAAALCEACDLNSKFLFVLPHGDHLQGYIVRLQNALYDIAKTFYHQEVKQIKLHKDHLNKTTHHYLFVRHQFKMGFFSEMKQEIVTAHKHYLQAYTYLKDVRIVETNALEVKLIAGFINYKLCYLMFKLNQPKDAVTQFRNHIELFKTKIGQRELLFEHHAWLSKQYFSFAEIFDEFIRMGLTAVQTQHPGYYYKQAAQQSMDRKSFCHELCKDVTTYPMNDPLAGENSLEFFGQRAWRACKLSAEPADIAREKEGIQSLQFIERRVDHSAIIISQLGSAISQFKTYRCPRMRRHLVVLMADEYYYSRDYGKALTLLSHMLWDYRSENWWGLMSTLLSRALACAYLSANVQDYITLSLEALGPSVQLTDYHKSRIYNNLLSVLEMKLPSPEPNISEDMLTSVHGLWSAANSGQLLTITIEMNNITSCIEIKSRFTSSTYRQGETVTVETYIRYNHTLPLEFYQLSLIINSPTNSSEIIVPTNSGDLLFEGGNVKKFLCEFTPNESDIGKEIQIGFVLLTLGSPNRRSAVLKFIGNGNESSQCEGNYFGLHHLKKLSAEAIAFEDITLLGNATISRKELNVEYYIKHDSPALLGEWFPIHVEIQNQDSIPLVASSLDVGFQSSTEDSSVDQSTQLCETLDKIALQSSMTLALGDILQGGKVAKTFYMRGHRVGERSIVLKVCYTLESAVQPSKQSIATKQEIIQIPVIKPFEVGSQLLSMKFEPITVCYARESFILSPTIQLLSPWPLLIHHSTVELGLAVKSVDKELKSHLSGTTLYENEGGTDMFALRIDEPSDQPVALGTYTLKWSRLGSNEITSSSITMPTARCEPVLLGVEMSLPAHGWVRKPMAVEYRLYNHSNNLVEVNLVMEASDAFMFAGHKQMSLRLLPDSVRRLEYNLYPLFSGLVALPRLMLTSFDQSEKLQQILERNLPSHVYVIPQEKLQSSAGL